MIKTATLFLVLASAGTMWADGDANAFAEGFARGFQQSYYGSPSYQQEQRRDDLERREREYQQQQLDIMQQQLEAQRQQVEALREANQHENSR